MSYPTSTPFLPQNPEYSLPLHLVVNPATARNTDGWAAPNAMGRNGDALISMVHDFGYAACSRGTLYMASFAGTTGGEPLLPAQTTSGLMVYNPTGTNIVMEIMEILVSPLTAASNVVAGIGLEYGVPPSVVGNAVTPIPMLIGGAANPAAVGKASYGSTIAAMTFLQWLPLMMMTVTTTVGGGSQMVYRPEGQLLVSPGGAINIIGKASQGANWMQHIAWAEWPI